MVPYKKLKNIYLAVFLQLTPFFSLILFFRIARIAPEAFLVAVVLVLITIVIAYIAAADSNANLRKFILGFGIICGLGLATKISFFPMLILPLIIIKKFSNKIYFSLTAAISFLIFVIPALSSAHINKFINWIKKLVIYSGKYGGGGTEILLISLRFFRIWKQYFSANLYFLFRTC